MKNVDLPTGWRLDRRGTVGSTNHEARLLADAGALEGTVVWADAQTEGRGRQDRVWESGDGGNLMFSVIVRPDCGLAEAGQLSFLTAVALAEAIGDVAPAVPVQCKWPNDLLGAHGKLSGILLEGCLPKGDLPPAVVVGVGVNIVWRPEEGALYPASSLAREGVDVSREAVLSAFLARFSAWMTQWRAEGFTPLRAAWMARARGLHQEIIVRLPKETVKGVFENLDGDGGLVLSGLPEGVRVIHAGDVFFG